MANFFLKLVFVSVTVNMMIYDSCNFGTKIILSNIKNVVIYKSYLFNRLWIWELLSEFVIEV